MARRPRRLPAATGSSSGIGTATAGTSTRCGSVTKVKGSAHRQREKPGQGLAGLFCLPSVVGREVSALRVDRLEHRFARPAIDLEARGLLIGAERGASQHAGLAVD